MTDEWTRVRAVAYAEGRDDMRKSLRSLVEHLRDMMYRGKLSLWDFDSALKLIDGLPTAEDSRLIVRWGP